MPKALKPPPYERSNWDSMNEGQRRYAMEQWQLARVRRGERFEAPGEGEDNWYLDNFNIDVLGNPQEPEVSSSQDETNAIDDFLQQVENNQMADVAALEPSSTSGKRTGDGQAPAAKKSKGGKGGKQGASGTSLPGTGGNLDGMSGGGAGDQVASEILRPIGLNVDRITKTYYKKWRFLTSANANVILDETASGTTPTRYAMTTGMASIPWEYAFFYMSPAEFNRMKSYPGTFAKSCSVKITAWNTRVAFQTGETQTANATLNQNKFLQIAKGFRSIPFIASSNRRYTFATMNEPMIPSSFAAQTSIQYRDKLKVAMYGFDNNATASDFISAPPADATGSEIYLQDYLTIYTNKGLPTVGFPPYKNFIEEYDASACINAAVVNMNYDFNYAPMVPQFDPVANTILTSTTASEIAVGSNIEQTLSKNMDAGHSATPLLAANHIRAYLQNPSANTLYFTEEQNYFRCPMEQSGAFEECSRKRISDAQQPSLNIGIRAVPKLTTIDNVSQATSFLDAQGYFEVECTLTTESHDPFTRIKDNCYSSNVKTQLQYFNTAGTRPLAHNYDFPNEYGRMQLLATSAP